MTPQTHGDPAEDRPMTMRQHPADAPGAENARRAIRTDGGVVPWIAVSGPYPGYPLSHDEVAGWPIAHPALWSPQLVRDLDHLRGLVRKELAS